MLFRRPCTLSSDLKKRGKYLELSKKVYTFASWKSRDGNPVTTATLRTQRGQEHSGVRNLCASVRKRSGMVGVRLQGRMYGMGNPQALTSAVAAFSGNI